MNNSLTRWKWAIFKIRYLRNSQTSVWKTNFFPRQAIPKILSVLDFKFPWDTPYRPWFDLNNSLTRWKWAIFKIRYLRNSQISVWKTNFFPRQAIPQILSVLDSRHPWDTPIRIWFDLDNSFIRWRRRIFKILFLRSSQISVWKTKFLPRQAIPKILSVSQSRYPWDTPIRVWFDLDNSFIRWRRRIFKILFLRNSQISIWKTKFLPRQAIPKILSVSDSRHPWDTPIRIWFDLDNSFIRWRRRIFKILFLRNSQISIWKTKFLPRQAIPKILSVSDSKYPWDTPYQVWFDLDNSLTRWKRPFFKIRYLRNSQISVWKTNIFPRQAIPKNLSVSQSRYPWDTPIRVWFDLNNSFIRWRRPIFKILFLRNSKISVWKTNFFPSQAIPKILSVLDSRYPWDTPCPVWFDLNNSLARWKILYFKIKYWK